MEPQWYYTLQGQQQGPVPEAQLRSLIQSGQLPPNEFVFKEGMSDWVAASSRPELMGSPLSAPAMSPSAFPATVVIPPRAGDLSIGSVYKEAFEVFKQSWIPLCLGFLLIFGVSIGVGFVTGIIAAIVRDHYNILGNVLGLTINGPLTLGMWFIILNAVDRKPVSPLDVLEGFKHFLPALVMNLLMMVAMIAGLIALIIGIFIVAVLLSFAWLYMADRNCSPVDAMKQSFECVKSNFFLVFVLIILWIPLAIAGFCAFLIGLIPATVFVWLSLAVAYRWLNPQTR